MDTRQKILAQMEVKGMKQRALAKAAGMHQPQLSRYLTGKAEVLPATLDKICAALGMVREERVYVPRPRGTDQDQAE
jgi:transcriptional regulator with XRE-family HTH domain